MVVIRGWDSVDSVGGLRVNMTRAVMGRTMKRHCAEASKSSDVDSIASVCISRLYSFVHCAQGSRNKFINNQKRVGEWCSPDGPPSCHHPSASSTFEPTAVGIIVCTKISRRSRSVHRRTSRVIFRWCSPGSSLIDARIVGTARPAP